jgi:ABC-type enterochelin transport system permease subunit
MSFFVYLAIVETHRFDNKYIYKGLMIIPLIGYGYGGVIMNVTRYLDTGLEFYFSFSAWAVAVLINLFGTIVNIVAIMQKPASSLGSGQSQQYNLSYKKVLL